MLFFALLIFIVNAAENNSFDNASIGNESNSSTFTATETSEQANAASSDNGTVAIEDSQPSESSEPSVNANSQTSEEKSKAVTASFGVYLEIVG